MLLTLYSLPEILFLKRHGLKGLYSWGVSWGVAYIPTMQLKKLATMDKYGLKVKEAKCEFGRKFVEYLGHIVGDGKLAVPEHTAAAMKEFK